MLVVMVWSEGSAREEAAAAYAATVSAITGGVVGLNRTIQACHPQGDATPVQQRDTVPRKWNARRPAVLVQAASLQDVVHRVNQWCPTCAVVIIAHHSVNVTTVTHPNVTLYLCEDNSAECLVEASTAAAVGAAWAQSNADLNDVIGVMLAPPSSRRFRVEQVRDAGDTSAEDVEAAAAHGDGVDPLPADTQSARRQVLLSGVPDAALGTVFDYLLGHDGYALRRTCRQLTTAFDAAIDNESQTMNGICIRDAVGAPWRWSPLLRIPRGEHRAREVYIAEELVDVPATRTLVCQRVVVRTIDFDWDDRLRHFRGMREVEVRGEIWCRPSFLQFDQLVCNARIHTVLTLSPQHALFLHGRKNEEPHHRALSIRELDSWNFDIRSTERRFCAGANSIGLRLGGWEKSDTAEALRFLPTVDLSRLATLEVEMKTTDAEALIAHLIFKAPNLETIRWHDGSLTDVVARNVKATWGDIGHLFARWRRLRQLVATNTNSALVEISKNYPLLERIWTSTFDDASDPVSDVGVAALTQGCPRLLNLCLPHQRAVGDAGVTAVAAHCPALTFLDLSDTGVTDAGIAVVAKHCNLLERLYISHTAVTSVCLDLGTGCPRMKCFSASITDSSALEHVLPYWPQLVMLWLGSMVPSASLFATFNRHNPQLYRVQLKLVESAAFTTPLSKGRRLMKVSVGEWVARSVTLSSRDG
jgi:hypothetical protein